MKISIIGAGNVGATLAQRIVESELADIVLVDIAREVAQGKALDLLHAAPVAGYQKEIIGTDDYANISGSDIIAVTAGFPRLPGMSRSDLASKNRDVVGSVIENIKSFSPDSIVIVVTNPLDVMTYLAYKRSGFKKSRVMGMAGVLDSSRFSYILASEFKVPYDKVETMVLGQHGPDMVPLISQTRISGKPLNLLAPKEKRDGLIKEVKESGAKIVGLLGKGSAYYAPSAAIFAMIRAIINDEEALMSVSCLAEGEYGISGVCIGLPVRLGRKGIIEIAKLDIEKEELEALRRSADSIKGLIDKL